MKSKLHQNIVTAYRHLWRKSLQTIRYSEPARSHLRDILRTSFRESQVTAYQPQQILRTIRFLDRARQYRGIEHRIVKNILIVRYWRGRPRWRGL